MRKFKNLDLELYEKKLENGLRIYVVPKPNVNNIYVTYTTNYGSVDTKFILDGEEITTPDGIAHFLEHKMFEQKDGIDPFKIFDQNGAQANAATSNYKTTYLFSGPSNFEENLNTLLDFVSDPYFTDENVEKEKGIIIQEIKMGEDQQGRVGYMRTLHNSFVNHPIKTKVIGSVESVSNTTKEDLYKCYDAFYNPSNMFLVITGNVNPKEVFKIVEENQNKKNYKIHKTEKATYDEPDKVAIKKEIINMNVTIPRVYFSYKINIENINLDRRIITKYLSIYLDAVYGSVSNFEEEIESEKIVADGIDFMISKTDKHLLLTFIAETKKIGKLVKTIKKYMGSTISIDEFNRKKKVILASNIFMSDNIYHINNKITNDILECNDVITDIYEENETLKYDTMIDIINKIDFKNTCEVIIKPNKTK